MPVVASPIRKFPAFYGKGSQEPTTDTYPEPSKSSIGSAFLFL
jgi:hypothetical protein